MGALLIKVWVDVSTLLSNPRCKEVFIQTFFRTFQVLHGNLSICTCEAHVMHGDPFLHFTHVPFSVSARALMQQLMFHE
jgi:hypothetical protein